MSNSLRVKLALICAVVMGLWLLVACDEEGDGDADADTDGDTDADTDADGDADGDADTDGDADGDTDADADEDVVILTCTEAVACIDACDTSTACVTDCGERVCPPAGGELGNLVACTARECSTECTDPTSAGCTTCINESCATELFDCHTASCTPGERSCGEVTICLGSCEGETACTECEESVCSEAADELTALMTCVGTSCETECADFGATECGPCVTENCATESTACLTAPCEV